MPGADARRRRRGANALYNASFPRNVARTELETSRDLLHEALGIYRRLADDSGTARCLWGLCQIHDHQGDFASALNEVDESIALFRKVGDRFGLGWALFLHASIASKMNDAETARAKSLDALKVFAAAKDVSGAGLGTIVVTREGWRTSQALSEAEEKARAEGKAMTLEQAIAYGPAAEEGATEIGA